MPDSPSPSTLRAGPAPYSTARSLSRPEYEGAFGLVLLGLILVSTLDDTFAFLARGFVLAAFALLTIMNAGAALGVYLGMAALLSVHHFAGQGSWAQRPDNFAFFMLFAYLAFGRSFGRGAGRGTGSGDWTAAAICALVVTALIHLVLLVGMSMYEVSWFIRSFVMPLGLFLVVRRAGLSPREIRAMLLVIAVIGLYHGWITLLEVGRLYDWIIPQWLADPDFNPFFGDSRMGGVPMQPEWNGLDTSLALTALVLRMQLGDRRGRIGWSVVALMCLVSVYFTYTRAAWLGLLVGGAALYWQANPSEGLNRHRRLLFLAGTVAFILFVLFFPSDLLRSRTGDSGTVYFRFSIWIASLDMMVQNPFWGVGFGQFALHLSPFLREVAWIPPSEMAQEGTLAHNTFLSVGAEFGLVGLALYVGILIGVYKGAMRAAGTSWGRYGQSWVRAYTAVYLVNVQFITAHKLTSNILYFGVMGAIAGMQAWRHAPSSSTEPTLTARRPPL